MSKKTSKKKVSRNNSGKEMFSNKDKPKTASKEIEELLNKRFLSELEEKTKPGSENPVESKKNNSISKRKRNKLKKSLVADENNKQMPGSENPVESKKNNSISKRKRNKLKKSLVADENNKQMNDSEKPVENLRSSSMPKKKKKKFKKSFGEDGNDEQQMTEIENTSDGEKSNAIIENKRKENGISSEDLGNDDDANEPEAVEAGESDGNHQKKKKLKKSILVQRYEPVRDFSEFSLTEVGKERVHLNELIETSQKLAGQVLVKKQLQHARKLKSLSLPLSKPQFEKIKRTVAYEKVCNEVAKWEPVVENNKIADQIIYPLKKPNLRLESFETVAERFVTKHPVQEAVSQLLKTSENTLEKTKTLTPAEEKALQAMSVEEAQLRHHELMKHRALMSYQEAKARRQNKIKSKRYHRILKHEKMKHMLKEFEELKKTDPAAALEKYLEADKLRIMERMTLKHRNTGKWAKQQKIRAKYNPESRSTLKEDLLIGQELKTKLPVEDTIADLQTKVSKTYSRMIPKPDMSLLPTPGLIEDLRIDAVDDVEPLLHIGEEVHELMDEEEFPYLHGDSTISEKPASLVGERDLPILQNSANFKKTNVKKAQDLPSKTNESSPKTADDDMDFSSEVTCLNSMVPDDVTFGDEESDDCHEEKMTIQQAFADEDLISEFREVKKAAEKANRPEAIDLFLPGWGSWGGPKIKPSKKKRERFLIKLEEPAPKKSTLGNVIINEDKDKKASAHQVRNLPFPFTNVHQFASYIRQPVGDTWNPQSSFRNLIAPKVITRMGKIIEPIDAEDVVLENKTKEVKLSKRKEKKQIKAF